MTDLNTTIKIITLSVNGLSSSKTEVYGPLAEINILHQTVLAITVLFFIIKSAQKRVSLT